MRIHQGNGGWHEVEGDLGLPGRVYFRVQPVDEALRITELYLDGRGEPLQSVARFPLGGLEQLASQASRERMQVAGPDLSRLAAYFAATFGKARHWVADSWRAQYADSGVPQAPMPKPRRQAEAEAEIRLAAPEEGLTETFLRDLAMAYEQAVQQRRPPASAIAEATGYPRRTVESWIYKARKRGIMPPAARKGRVV
jgi:hypothetical protein